MYKYCRLCFFGEPWLINTGTLWEKLQQNNYVEILPCLRSTLIEYWQFHEVQLSVNLLVDLRV